MNFEVQMYMYRHSVNYICNCVWMVMAVHGVGGGGGGGEEGELWRREAWGKNYSKKGLHGISFKYPSVKVHVGRSDVHLLSQYL